MTDKYSFEDKYDRDEHRKFKFGTSLEDQIASLDLSVEEGLKILASADMRMGKNGGLTEWPQIYYKDEWWVICRTDLTDNVGTGGYMGSNLDETRNNLAKHIRYGVRLYTHEDGRKSFLCVDSWSDG